MSAPGPSASSAPDAVRPQAAAPLARRVGAQAGFELAAVLRNGEQLLLTLVLPALLLGVLARTTLVRVDAVGPAVDLVAPGVLALAVISTAFTSQAIATGFDRRAGVLRYLSTTPLGPGGLAAGKALGILGVEVVQFAVLGATALALGWRPEAPGSGPAGAIGASAAALLAVLLGTAAFTALALVVAGALRAEAVLAVANLVWVLLLAGGGVVLPADRLPGALRDVVGWLPSAALGDALRAAAGAAPGDGGLGAVAVPLLVLAGWTVALGALATRTFRWQ